jgi:hypothetical protein
MICISQKQNPIAMKEMGSWNKAHGNLYRVICWLLMKNNSDIFILFIESYQEKRQKVRGL